MHQTDYINTNDIMKIYDIFISYRRTDSAFAQQLYSSLANVGQSVFWDKKCLENGKYGQDIEIAINNCNNFILIINDDTFDRCYDDPEDWINKEVLRALEKKKNIIPLFIGEKRSFPKPMPETIKNLSEYNGITGFNVDNREKMQILFEKFLAKREVYSNLEDYEIKDGVLIKCVNQKISMLIPEGVKEVAANAFSDCTSIKEIIFNDSLTMIGENAFCRCNMLEYVDMPPALKTIGKRAFYRCQHLKAINLSESIERIDEQAFAFCNSIKSIVLDEKLEDIDITAFEECSSLENITIEVDNKNYTTIDGVLYNKNCTQLLKCPPKRQGVLLIPDTVNVIGKYAFSGSQLSKICITGEINEIDKYAFLNSSVVDIVYDNDTDNTKVDKLAFLECINLKNNPFPIKKEEDFSENKYIKERLLLYEYIMIKTSFESEEEAYNMVKMLLDRELIVSGQISIHRAIYKWNTAICDENEYELLCFTRGLLYEDVESFILKHHSYECPEILCFPVVNTSVSFGQWINEGTFHGGKTNG